MDFIETACICALKFRRNKKRQKLWVHPLLSNRLCDGQFYKLFESLRKYETKFFNYFRMSVDSFDKLLALVGRNILYQDTVLRKAVPPEERLAVTLRYLATGNSFASLHYEFLLGDSTIRKIIRETCDVLWKCLLPHYMPAMDSNSWLKVSQDFFEKTQFPNCIGAVDGKHIRIKKPNQTGSEFYNYKSFFSTVLLAIADSNYNFIYVEVGAYGASSDSNLFKKSLFSRKLVNSELNIPEAKCLPNDVNGKVMPFVIIGDEAFGVSKFVLRPYSGRNLSVKKRIFNYRLSRARRMIECTFGILANKWRILHRALDTSLDFSESIIKACCILHNYVRKHDGVQFEDTLYECPLECIPSVGVRSNTTGISTRDYFSDYFTSPYGSVPWQYDKI